MNDSGKPALASKDAWILENNTIEVPDMKLLLFGPPAAGKTSLLRSIVDKSPFMAIENLAPTKGVARETFIFRRLLEITAWDAGGQKTYQDRYYGSQKQNVFSAVDLPIYMVDASVINEDVRPQFDKFIDAILEFTPDVNHIYILINKVDLKTSREEEVFKILTRGLEDEIHRKCSFAPVSVKLGSAQERFIEIMDRIITERTESMAKASKLRGIMEEFKKLSGADFALFNKNDGLLVSSTYGKFSSPGLQFVSFELSALESNIYGVFEKFMEITKQHVTPLLLNTIVFETSEQYVMAKEVEEKATIMVVTPDKKLESLVQVIQVISDTHPIYEQLINILDFMEV
ncbi:hypothetical protein GF325_10940 [Candidatus Bathyarchaeota archaeon]|nr:hypothetical protein [Candidatus Bathyarchaeota archaeon]